MPVAARHCKDAKKVVFAIFVWLLSVMIVVTGFISLYLMFTKDRSYGMLFLVALGAYLVLWTFRFLMNRSLSCQLCHGPILQSRRCRKHRDAKRYGFLGYTQSILIDATLRGRYTCMYCGTPFRLLR